VLDTYTTALIIPSHMTTYQAIKHYGTQVKLAAALGISQASVSEWGDYPPKLRQLQLQQITRSRLKAEPGLLAVKQS
jgi:DNA-binding transcriptional regulator YdaS (Cro superfamily)